jgi:hypothetical protein
MTEKVSDPVAGEVEFTKDERYLNRITEDRKAMMEGAGGLIKWVFATLVLINAGALLSIVGRAGVTSEAVSAARPFMYGVVAAVLAGGSAGITLLMMVRNTTWLIGIKDYDFPDEDAQPVAVWTIVTGVLAAVALACFATGTISVGGTLQREANAARVLAKGQAAQQSGQLSQPAGKLATPSGATTKPR